MFPRSWWYPGWLFLLPSTSQHLFHSDFMVGAVMLGFHVLLIVYVMSDREVALE